MERETKGRDAEEFGMHILTVQMMVAKNSVYRSINTAVTACATQYKTCTSESANAVHHFVNSVQKLTEEGATRIEFHFAMNQITYIDRSGTQTCWIMHPQFREVSGGSGGAKLKSSLDFNIGHEAFTPPLTANSPFWAHEIPSFSSAYSAD